MKQAEIDALSGAAFTTGEISRVRRIILDKTFPETSALLEGLTLYDDAEPTPAALADNLQAERKLMRSHLIVFFDRFPDGSLKIKGGKRGLDADDSRDREELRREVRLMLGLPMISPAVVASLEIKFRQSQSVSSSRTAV